MKKRRARPGFAESRGKGIRAARLAEAAVQHRSVERIQTANPATVNRDRSLEARATHRTRARSVRSGFTLLEVLLVLAVIALFAGMTMPSVMRMFGQQQLTESAERVRAAIASARVQAIETGITYQFCCETSGGHFVVVPSEPDHVNSNGSGSTGQVVLLGRSSGRLPKGIVFGSAVSGVPTGNSPSPATTTSQKLSMTSLDGLPNASDLASLNWASPILFNSDGSAGMDTEIVVSDPRAQHVRLRIRSLTGAVSLGRIYSENR